MEKALASLKEAIAGTDTDAIKQATERLRTASQASASGGRYEEAAKANAPSASAPTGNDEDIVDAEIVDEQ